MNTITYSAARSSLADIMDSVVDNHEAVIITRGRKKAVVMLSLEDYKAIEETAYLLHNPKNAQRVLESIDQFKAEAARHEELRLAT